jgi:hypothetical protein
VEDDDVGRRVRQAVAAEKAGLNVETKPESFPFPRSLKEKFRNDPRFWRCRRRRSRGR